MAEHKRKKELHVDLVPALRKLEVLTKQTIASSGIVGQYSSAFKGRGLEFKEYRGYSQGDDAALIDWKASKKAGNLLVKDYVEERNAQVVFAFDVSRSMVFGSQEKLKHEYAIEFIASLSHAILEVGDSVGLVMYSSRLVRYVPVSRNRSQFFDITRGLANPELYGGGFDFSGMSKFLLQSLNRDTVVILVSDFIGLDAAWQRSLKLLASKFDVMSIMVRDPLDRTLPGEYRGSILVRDPFSSKQMVMDPALFKQVYEREVARQEGAIEDAFIAAGADFTLLLTNEGFVKPIFRLFRLRAEKLRR